jgi:hypothetical protein
MTTHTRNEHDGQTLCSRFPFVQSMMGQWIFVAFGSSERGQECEIRLADVERRNARSPGSSGGQPTFAHQGHTLYQQPLWQRRTSRCRGSETWRRKMAPNRKMHALSWRHGAQPSLEACGPAAHDQTCARGPQSTEHREDADCAVCSAWSQTGQVRLCGTAGKPQRQSCACR